MYKLYTNQDAVGSFQNQSTITLQVPQIKDPRKWLTKPFKCIQCFKLKTNGEEESLEMYICSPVRSGKYYAIGEGVIISTTDLNDTFNFTTETINMLLKRSIHCHKPYIEYICENCPLLYEM